MSTLETKGDALQRKQQEYEFHPIANVFPLMKGDEFKRFKKDIRTNKLREQIIIYEGKILDGRNRYNACKELGLPVDTKPYIGTDPVAFVISRWAKFWSVRASTPELREMFAKTYKRLE